MASIFKNPIYVIGGIAVLGAVIWALQPDAAPTKPAAPAKKTTVAAKGNDLIQPEDYKVHFVPISAAPKDLFKPLVTKKPTTATGPTTSTGVIPTGMLGDGKSWAYTGMATVDGVITALVECQADGTFAYLKPGEDWNSCKIDEVTPDELVLSGVDGVPVTVKVKDISAPSGPGTVNRPIGGGLNGPIGNQMAISPDDGSVVDNSGDTSGTTGGGRTRGNRGRGRGGRRGGRGGTGGGGG